MDWLKTTVRAIHSGFEGNFEAMLDTYQDFANTYCCEKNSLPLSFTAEDLEFN